MDQLNCMSFASLRAVVQSPHHCQETSISLSRNWNDMARWWPYMFVSMLPKNGGTTVWFDKQDKLRARSFSPIYVYAGYGQHQLQWRSFKVVSHCSCSVYHARALILQLHNRHLSQRLQWHHPFHLRPHGRDHTRISFITIFQGSYFVTSKRVVLRKARRKAGRVL